MIRHDSYTPFASNLDNTRLKKDNQHTFSLAKGDLTADYLLAYFTFHWQNWSFLIEEYPCVLLMDGDGQFSV